MEKILLGYAVIDEKDDYFTGAVLVTDQRGIPVDFRYTEPVRPTRLERILYGQALDIYLREEVILHNLLTAVEVKPLFWLSRDSTLLKAIQKISRLPSLCLEASTSAPLEQTGQIVPQLENNVFLFQADNISSPLRVTLTEESVSKLSSIAPKLVDAANEMELLEPFIRMDKAIEAVTDSSNR